jgi:hypothetical protein
MIVDIIIALSLAAVFSMFVIGSDRKSDEMICVGFCQRTITETHTEPYDPNDQSVEESEDE